MITQSEDEIIKDVRRARERGDRVAEARYLGLLATKYKQQGKFYKAIETFEEVVKTSKSIGDLNNAASALFGIATIYWAKPTHPFPGLGDINRAIAYAEQAISLESRSIKKAEYLGILSSWYAMTGNVERAIFCSDLAASIHESYNIDREKRMRYISEFAKRGYV